jgi:2-iminobutanoate/2-iminopropanoate deaminase
MKECLSTDKAPAPVGSYSQAVRAGNLVFVSGQIPLVPDSMRMVEGRIGEQTHQALRNIQAIVESAGGTLADVVKTTVYVTDLADFGIVNEIYKTYFPENPPARSTIQVAALPKGSLIEIEAIADV